MPTIAEQLQRLQTEEDRKIRKIQAKYKIERDRLTSILRQQRAQVHSNQPVEMLHPTKSPNDN